MAKNLIIILLLVASCTIGFARQEMVDSRKFDEAALQEYRASSDFNYANEYVDSGSFLQSLFYWLRYVISDFFNFSANASLGINLFRIIIIAILIFGIVMIVKLKFGGLITSDSTFKGQLNMTVHTSESVDYAKLFDDSQAQNDLKLSIRYLYLLAIQNLHKQGKIKLSIWKTTIDYLYELPEQDKMHFSKLTSLFEATWYGDHEPNQDEFETVFSHAKQLNLA